MINDCKNCYSVIYDSGVGWCCTQTNPMELCEEIKPDDCPIRKKKFIHQQMEEALAIVNDRKVGALKEAEPEVKPVKKKRKPRKAVKKMVEHRMDENDGKLKEFLGRDGYMTYCRGCVLAEMMEADLTLDGLKRARLRITKMIEDKEDE